MQLYARSTIARKSFLRVRITDGTRSPNALDNPALKTGSVWESSPKKPIHLSHREREAILSWTLLASVRWHFGGNTLWRSQFHSDQLAHAALLHCHPIKNIGFGNSAFVVCDDNKLALLYEALQYTDKPVDVAFVHCRIHFVENAKRAWAHHVNRE